MYENYYNLKAMPFQITTDPRFLWLGEKHSEALATLKYGILENKGFLLLTGDVGTGKTALINRLIKIIDVAAIVAKIPDPGLGSLDFFNFLAVEFKMKKKFDTKGQFLIHLRHFLHQAYSRKKQVLLIIDEAQRLNPDLLEEIRLLSNIELQNRKLINIFFVGQPEFNETLMEDRNRPVRQRITVSYHIEPLSEIEVRRYIKHRLKVAGAAHEIFSKDAVRRIHAFSAGYPRLINIMCDHALLTGYASGVKTINQKIIKECERELQIPLKVGADNGKGRQENTGHQNKNTVRRPDKPSTKRRTGLSAAMIILLVIGVYFFTGQKFDDVLRWKDDALRWTMDEIAPQKYQGPSPEEMKKGQGDGHQASKLKDNKPIDEIPSGKQAQQTNLTDESPKKTTVNETAEAASLLKRKFIVYFKHNSNELPEQSFETLNRIADFMLNRPTTSIDIRGHSDSIGSEDYNVSVSRFRANTIKTFLVGKGIEPAKIKSVGMGSKNPIATNTTAAGRSKNRRVELEINVRN